MAHQEENPYRYAVNPGDYIVTDTGHAYDKPYIRDYLVSPEGRIKTVRYHYNTQPPQLDVDKAMLVVNHKPVAMRRPRVSAEYAEDGWVYLSDLYAHEGRLADYKTFCDWREALENNMPDVPEELPQEYLPNEIVRRTELHKSGGKFMRPGQAEFKLPPLANKKAVTVKDDNENSVAPENSVASEALDPSRSRRGGTK